MKLYFVLLVALVAAASAMKGDHKKRMELMQECLKENGVTEDEFKSSFSVENPSHNIKCTYHCMSKKMGLLNAEETPDLAKVLEKFGKTEKAAAAIKQCYESTQGQGDKCELNYAFKKCAMKALWAGKGKNRRMPKDDDAEDDDGNV